MDSHELLWSVFVQTLELEASKFYHKSSGFQFSVSTRLNLRPLNSKLYSHIEVDRRYLPIVTC